MYHKTIEEENEFRCNLWHVFDNWVISKDEHPELGTEVVPCEMACPKCRKGKIINYGTIEPYHKNLHSFGMKHVCENCHEVFDRIRIYEDIYNNTPYDMVDHLDTPLGLFQVLRNEKKIAFRYWTAETDIDGTKMTKHFIDIDTSSMKEGDKVFAGIKGAGLEYLDGDERCSFRSAENEEYFLVLNGEEIDDYEVDIEDYSFVTEGADGDGYEYLVHRDPYRYTDKPPHSCRVISLILAWGRKDMCDNYEEIIEEVAW